MIDAVEVFRLFQQFRKDAIGVPGRGRRPLIKKSDRPNLDIPLGDTAQGGHASISLGRALAQPEKKVVLFDTEGDVLMGLGILPTIAEHLPQNFYHFMLDNECYATTGGQPVANAKKVSYDTLARGAGYPRAYSFDNLETLAINIERILSEPGPVFVALKVVPVIQNVPIGQRNYGKFHTPVEVFKDLRRELGIPD